MNNQPLSPGLLKNIGFLVSQSDRPARLGLAGNQPLRTRSTCSFTSLMLQKQLKAVTPSNDEPMTDRTHSAAARKIMPATRNIHFTLTPI